jgi:hypothetical protein
VRTGVFQFLLAVVVVGGLLALTASRYLPPEVIPKDAPPTAFSAERARLELERVLGEGAPRPVGSAAADAARQRIVARLRELGYAPSVQDAFACGEIRSCARVRNILALRPGREMGKLVVLSAHYDSVGAGPGASDDGMGVAAQLEIARALAASPPARNGVLFLFNDGEEVGLLGAEAFISEHPLAARVGAVVNVEARGTTGPSFMFELSEPNGWLVRLYAANVRRPATNSVAYAVYRLLPNDTDLTVYRRAGLAGLNFAIIGGEPRYHTPRDDVAHADQGSLQHHGDNALAMARALAETDLDARPAGEDVFFDLFALRTLCWPLSWMRPGAAAAALIALLGTWLAVRRGRTRGREVAWGFVAWMFGVALSAAAVAGTHAALKELGAFPYAWIASPAAARTALWGAGILGVAFVSTAFAPLAREAGLWLGATLGWAVAGVAAAVLSPDMSYLVVLPALAAAVLGALWSLGPPRRSAAAGPVGAWAWLPPHLVGAAVWMPLIWVLYDALGEMGLAVSGAAFGVLLTLLAPVFTALRARGVLVSGILVVAIACAWARQTVKFTSDSPNKLRLDYVLDASGVEPRAKWAALSLGGELPPALQKAAGFDARPVEPLPWPSWRPSYLAEAKPIRVAPPELEILERAGQNVRVRLSSPRGALDAGLVVPSQRLRGARVNGKPIRTVATKNVIAALRSGAMSHVLCHTTAREGVEVELDLAGDTPVEVFVWDSTDGLPEAGAALLAARGPEHVTFQQGDRTLVYTRRTLHPGRGR